jgi:hypothetical protein
VYLGWAFLRFNKIVLLKKKKKKRLWNLSFFFGFSVFVVSHFINFSFPSFSFWRLTYLSLPISGEQGEYPMVVSESEKSLENDLQVGSVDGENLDVDIEEFQVRFVIFF